MQALVFATMIERDGRTRSVIAWQSDESHVRVTERGSSQVWGKNFAELPETLQDTMRATAYDGKTRTFGAMMPPYTIVTREATRES